MTDDDQSVREPAATRTDAEPESRQKPSGAVGGEMFAGTRESRAGDDSGSDEQEIAASEDIDAIDEDDLDDGESAESKDVKPGSFWRELPVLIAVALGLALLIKAFLVQAFFIPSASMENTLQIGDRVLVNKVVYHVRPVKRGDVVVFNGLDSWDPEVNYSEPSNPAQQFFQWIGRAFGFVPGEKDYIKRVIGVPGDKVRCCDAQGRVTVNGQALEESAYLYPGDEPSAQPFKFTIPDGRLWVMGDHRSLSYDSRQHLGDEGRGSIPESRVIGRAFVVVWPASRWKSLDIPQTFDQPGLGAAALPATPLALGFVGAIPVTLLNRRLRLRRRRRGILRRSRAADAAGAAGTPG